LYFPITYRANGKLLLTGEYFVLHGAKALALPLKVGQQLAVYNDPDSNSIVWRAFHDEQIWFSCELNPTNFAAIKSNHPEKSETLSRIFKIIRTLNPAFLPKAGTRLETSLDSNPDWGFGSSSTLISLLSQWAGVDPFVLNELLFKGSGFDIACAIANGPIFYRKSEPVQQIDLDYPFADQLFLVYSGQKKKTSTEVKTFLKEKKASAQLIDEVSNLTDHFAECQQQENFNQLIREHEKIVGRLIKQTPVKDRFFADFEGEIKSLGAWGGDFYLVSAKLPFSGVKKYFENKRLTTVLRWNDLILKRETQ
jgi:mevalonate kinase